MFSFIGKLLGSQSVLPAVISALTALLTLFLSKFFLEKRGLIDKQKVEFEYEQRKQIREGLSKHKVRLLDAAEGLNHRLCDFYEKSYKKNLLTVNGDYRQEYYSTTVYRFLAFFAWIRIVEKDIVYFDTMNASKKDLQYITFLKLFPLIFCGGGEIVRNSGLAYHNFTGGDDRFYRNEFERMSDYLINEEKTEVYPYQKPDANLTKIPTEVERLLRFLDGVSATEDRVRWDLLQVFHFTLIAFLNTFGFEYQKLDEERIKKIHAQHRKNILLNGYYTLLDRYKMFKVKPMRDIILFLLRQWGKRKRVS